MNNIEKDGILNHYCLVPNIRDVLINAKESHEIKEGERLRSLRYCLSSNLVSQYNNNYYLTPKGEEALSVIEEFIQNGRK